MARPDLRKMLNLESLEIRQVLSGAAPTADAQYMLELVNLARTNPAQAANVVTSNLTGDEKATVDYYGVNLDQVKSSIASAPVQPPLAYSDQLGNSATAQSNNQINAGTQSHTGPDGSTPETRVNAAGYSPSTKVGENTYAYADNVDDAVKAFLIDWGVAGSPHRSTIQEPGTPVSQNYTQVGFGIVPTDKPGIGPVVVTQDFGSQPNSNPFLLGVAYSDNDHTGLYSPGEGRGGVTIDTTNLTTGATAGTQTAAAGGYQIQLAPGDYQVTARVGDQVIKSQNVSIGSENVKVDFVTSKTWQGTVTPAVVTPTPAPVAPVVSIPVSTPVTTTPVVQIHSTPVATPTTPVVTPTPTPVVVTTPTKIVTPTDPASNANAALSVVSSLPVVMPVVPSTVEAVKFDVSWMLSWSQWTTAKKMN